MSDRSTLSVSKKHVKRVRKFADSFGMKAKPAAEKILDAGLAALVPAKK